MAAALIIDDEVRARLSQRDISLLRSRLRRMVRAAGLSEAVGELEAAFRLTDDSVIHQLNREYRDKDRPTDVLAFAAREGPAGHLQPQLLGDVVISVDTAARQSKGTLFDELVFLASHGLCHLLGYDHRDDDEERVMNERMATLRRESERRGPTRPA